MMKDNATALVSGEGKRRGMEETGVFIKRVERRRRDTE